MIKDDDDRRLFDRRFMDRRVIAPEEQPTLERREAERRTGDRRALRAGEQAQEGGEGGQNDLPPPTPANI